MSELSQVQKTMIRQMRAQGWRGTALYENDGLTVMFKLSSRKATKLTYVPGLDLYEATRLRSTGNSKVGWKFHSEEIGALDVEQAGRVVRGDK